MNILDLFEHRDDLVVFEVANDTVLEHVVDNFGAVVEWTDQGMAIPRSHWAALQESADGAVRELKNKTYNEGPVTTAAPEGTDNGVPGQQSDHALQPVDFAPQSGRTPAPDVEYASPAPENADVQAAVKGIPGQQNSTKLEPVKFTPKSGRDGAAHGPVESPTINDSKQGVAECWGAEKQARDLEASNAKWRPYVEKYKDDPVMSDYFKFHRIYGGNTPEQAEQKALADAESGKKLPDWWTNPKPVGGYKLPETTEPSTTADIMTAFSLIAQSLEDPEHKNDYSDFIQMLRDRNGKEYANKIHKAAGELHPTGRPGSPLRETEVRQGNSVITTLADAIVKNHSELFSQYGDEFVMSVIGRVAAKLQKIGANLDANTLNAAERAVVTRVKNSGTELYESRSALIKSILEDDDAENKLITAGEALDLIKDFQANEPVVTPVSIKFSDSDDNDHKIPMVKRGDGRYVKVKELRKRLQALRDASSELHEDASDEEAGLKTGDPVRIVGRVQGAGKTGTILDFAPSGRFAIVAVNGQGNSSYSLSDLEYYSGSDEEELDEAAYDSESVEAVEGAIIRRIMVAHRDELIKYGPARIMNAARETAESVGSVDEIGTSDVSAWTKRTLDDLAREAVDQRTPEFTEDSDPCWKGYEMVGMKEKNGRKVPNCVPLEETLHGDEFYESYGDLEETLEEAEYQGRTVTLNKPMRGDVKKFKVYVKDPSTGNVKKVNFGDPDMRIKKSNPERRKSFRARHKCDTAKDKTTARYWSCRKW